MRSIVGTGNRDSFVNRILNKNIVVTEKNYLDGSALIMQKSHIKLNQNVVAKQVHNVINADDAC